MRIIIETTTNPKFTFNCERGYEGILLPEQELHHTQYESFCRNLQGKNVHVLTDDPIMLYALCTNLTATEYRVDGKPVGKEDVLWRSFFKYFKNPINNSF